MRDSLTWWGTTRVPVGETRRWRLGPTTLYVERAHAEWRIAHELGDDPADDALCVAAEVGASEVPVLERANAQRFGVSDDSDLFHLLPRTADRSVVARPLKPYAVPAGERVVVWVGTPVWVRIEVGDKRRLLADTAVYPAANTWFGSTTAEGELCYASRSVFRAHFADVQSRPHRATTTVRIDNQASVPLMLERVNVPVPYLPLYASEGGALWTPEVTLTHRDAHAMAPLEVAHGAPSHAAGAREVAPPRHRGSENMLVRAFGSLFAQ